MPVNVGGYEITKEMENTFSQIVKDGLVLHLDAGIADSYPGSGTTWFDLSPSEINATLTNGPTYTTLNGGAIDFDGIDDYVTIDGTEIDFSTEQTIFMVLKPEESDSSRRNPYNQAYGGYGTITHEPAGDFNYYHGTNGGNAHPYQGTNSSFTVTQDEIAVISLVRNTTNVIWFKNGDLINTNTNSYPTASSSSNTILIADGYKNNYLGKIYLCLLYNRALSATEITQNYNAVKNRYGI